MKTIRSVFLAALVALLVVLPAFADSPHFIYATASLDASGNLTATFKEAGLGDNQLINVTLSADATAVYYCVNGGGNHPKATNKETVSGPISTSGEFLSGKNGSIVGSLTLSPIGPGQFSCPPGQDLVLGEVSYTNVMLADTTNGVSIAIAGTFSKVFIRF